MALFKYDRYLDGNDGEAFDRLHSPGDATPHSGIYRCEGCGREIASNAGYPLPSQNHSQHDPAKHGAIRWRMIVHAEG
jgi:hypothetical protein